MVKRSKLSRLIPRRYRHYPYLVVFICLLICLIYFRRSQQSQANITTGIIDNGFDLFDDDDMPLECPRHIQFNMSKRRHLAIIVGPKLLNFLWDNFLALLCTGVDAYVMLDEVFDINSSSRGDDYEEHTNRSIRSYTHRFLYVPDETLAKYGVRYMTKFPAVEYTVWDRAIVWLYHRKYLSTVWVMNYGVQWFHVYNMTYLFDLYNYDTTDLLCADIVRLNSTPWQNWPQNQSDIFPKSYWLGTFAPLVRWSRRLLLHHYQYMQLIHKNRLQYEIERAFRFQEFLMATIANIEKLSIALYNQKNYFTHISLGDNNQSQILSLLRDGKHIIHPITYESILTLYHVNDIEKLMRRKN